MKLNFGCGEFKKEHFINVDNNPVVHPDLLLDLNKIPYTFEDNSIDRIEADHVLEHLYEPFIVMREWWRILKPSGLLVVRVPHYTRVFTHPDHKRGFDVTFPCYFNPHFAKSSYTGIPFKLQKVRFHWFAQPLLKRKVLSWPTVSIATMIGSVIDSFANLSPYFCSKIWCFWVGGFDEIEFRFKPQKRPSP